MKNEIKSITNKITIAKAAGIHKGAHTQNQEMAICPISFKTRSTQNKMLQIPALYLIDIVQNPPQIAQRCFFVTKYPISNICPQNPHVSFNRRPRGPGQIRLLDLFSFRVFTQCHFTNHAQQIQRYPRLLKRRKRIFPLATLKTYRTQPNSSKEWITLKPQKISSYRPF